MKGVSKLVLLVFVLSFFILRSKIDFPIILDEAKESYTAYSIIKTGKDTNGDFPGLFFRSNNNYLSSLGVYFRIPSIYLFGLSDLGVRLPSIVFSLITVYFFYLVSRHFLKNKNRVLLATFLFAISPFFIQLNIFDLGTTLG
ncbi:MAG: glycosyltransferase family 39 protein, partial [Microgenomates group bacterium]